jgi:TrmH family RNA methyltransferase
MIVVVLHEPQELANIAHVVRAMKNFGVADLRLVAPREFDAYRIEGIAHRSADVLARTRVLPSLDEALADCIHVVGFTARERTAKRNVRRPREGLAEALERGAEGPVALLFGREDKGLSNEALDRCHRIVTIPSGPAYPSLNLGHAVAIALYELALARGEEERPFKPPRRTAGPATAGDLERLFADVERALAAIGFFKSHVEEQVMRTVREVVHREPLDEREARLLRAMALEAAWQAGRARAPEPPPDGPRPAAEG